MEKIFLKPTQTEILIKGSSKEGHLDIFSYDYNSDEIKRKLGNLYLIGNTQQGNSTGDKNPDTESDIAYIANLVASLAKREYYSNPDLSPKEAFSATLKKINDVVSEFFTSKDVKINMGIFALAGESINISKIGKFKIILARDDKTIDILNNIDLFTKERVEEKEFSHVISGKISSGDKILAFYPSRLITAREKALKENLLLLNTEQFVEKLNTIKEEKSDFACAALHINLSHAKEPAISPKMIKFVSPMAIATKTTREKGLAKEALPSTSAPAQTASINKEDEGISSDLELPRIIRSEFSLGKKDNPFAVAFGKIKMLLPKRQNKFIFFASLGVVVLLGAWGVKSLFIISPSQRQATNVLNEAKNNIKLAKTKTDQNDLLGARKILLGSIASISSITSSNKAGELKDEIFKLLDNLDNASETFPTLVETLPKGVSDEASLLAVQGEKTGASGLDIYEDNLYFIAIDGISKIADISGKAKEPVQWLRGGTLPPEPLLLTVDGKVYVLSKSGLLTTYYKGEKQSEINTLILLDDSSVLATTKDSQYLYLINKNMGRIYILSKATGTLFKTLKVSSQEAFVEAYLDQDEAIYLIGKDNRIWKIQ